MRKKCQLMPYVAVLCCLGDKIAASGNVNLYGLQKFDSFKENSENVG